ncbi:olfactory receptor 2D3-like [Ambystoma mexicanum]|uniref:olfactory receptor 2D3-like n=1 Tax=Ambystoma mexicanum TaxID=8296 RepID=UPI0037E98094
MEKWNESSVAEFLLTGLSEDPHVQVYLVMLFLVLYMTTLVGNTILITAYATEQRLHTPMYFFLVNLSFLDICYSTVIQPNMLVQFLSVRKSMSFSACVCQMFAYMLPGCTECVLLALMGYDRYVAISFPLRYNIIMSKPVCITMASCCWISGSAMSVLDTVVILLLPFCGRNVIDHFFCEATALLKLACADTFITEMVIFGTGVYGLLMPTFIIILSYVRILIAIMGIRTAAGRYKAFSTCASHLIVVFMFYGTTIFMYMKPSSKKSGYLDKIVSVFYTVIPPMLNPLIYSLRNKDVKMAMQKITRTQLIP